MSSKTWDSWVSPADPTKIGESMGITTVEPSQLASWVPTSCTWGEKTPIDGRKQMGN